MRKIIKAVVTIVMLGAVCFLGGEWPEETPRNKVIAFDAGALATAFACGFYLKKTEGRNNG